ncbi:hypothetical protein GGI19_003827 [Coemansia pectinata]|uniref:Uncharacterized protein n=1 Tax=Coemansia pectinata TaxID=1052879 RepID=A0A9W8GZX3_9FUNG|nr:hypothetical protein GGI19_003827 [Coemansia pectinata]
MRTLFLIQLRRGATSIVKRRFHTTRLQFQDEWPTAENIILQRVNSPGIHPSFSHLKTDKEEPKAEPLDNGSISSVSGIINSVRETRAASQRSPWHKDEPLANDLVDDDGEPEVPYFLFDTHEMVDRLLSSGFTRGQATAIMTVVKRRVHENMAQVQAQMLTKSDLENDAYLFRAALQELRMEMQMTRKNDQSLLESQAAGISREIESLFQRTNDQIANLRSDIEIEMNNHKHDTSLEMKGMDMELHELATKYQMLMGEMKTDIEAIKLGSIRRGLITVVLTALFLSAIFWGPRVVKRAKSRKEQEADDDESAEVVVAPVPDSGRSSDSGSELASIPNTGTAYRDYSHLNIRYHPTAAGASGFDDWFDSAYYSQPQDKDDRSASLMESDSQVDSTFWNNNKASTDSRIPVLLSPPSNSDNNQDS